MHARIEQLLSLRDSEPVDAVLAQHVAECAHCAAELRRVHAQREALQSLAGYEAPSDWSAIERRLARRPVRRRARHWAAAVALLVLGSVLVIAYQHPPRVAGDSQPLARAAPDPQIVALQQRSRALEHALQTLPSRPAIERVGTAATIDGLEQRIQWLDHHLSDAPDAGLDEEQAALLWQERVALLDTLVKVRYAESGAYVF